MKTLKSRPDGRRHNGGARKGAGAKKGKPWPSTLNKIAAREALRVYVMQHMERMTKAQIEQACGLSYLVTRDTASGKFIRVGESMARRSNEETIEVWEKDPSTAAFTDLMNRALDKPKEQEKEIRLTGDEGRIALLLAGRQRAREGR